MGYKILAIFIIFVLTSVGMFAQFNVCNLSTK